MIGSYRQRGFVTGKVEVLFGNMFKLTLHKTDGTTQVIKCKSEQSLDLELEVAAKRKDVVGMDVEAD